MPLAGVTLTVFHLLDHTVTAMSHFLPHFSEQMFQNLDPDCVKFPLKKFCSCLQLLWVQQCEHPLSRKFAPFEF